MILTFEFAIILTATDHCLDSLLIALRNFFITFVLHLIILASSDNVVDLALGFLEINFVLEAFPVMELFQDNIDVVVKLIE